MLSTWGPHMGKIGSPYIFIFIWSNVVGWAQKKRISFHVLCTLTCLVLGLTGDQVWGFTAVICFFCPVWAIADQGCCFFVFTKLDYRRSLGMSFRFFSCWLCVWLFIWNMWRHWIIELIFFNEYEIIRRLIALPYGNARMSK